MQRPALIQTILVLTLLTMASGCKAESPLDSRGTVSETQEAKLLAPQGRVTDAASILSPTEEARITAKVEAFENATHHQLAVVTVPSLQGQDVERFTLDLARRWGIGRRYYNDGVVLLVAPTERQVRIEVGTGLEKRLTDQRSREILRQAVLPQLRQSDFAAGIESGVDAIVAALDPVSSQQGRGDRAGPIGADNAPRPR